MNEIENLYNEFKEKKQTPQKIEEDDEISSTVSDTEEIKKNNDDSGENF